MPLLVGRDAHDRVAEVAILAQHVRVRVVSKLCDFFQPSDAHAWSHSHVVEWIFGSRIQSHWPCMMLWPS